MCHFKSGLFTRDGRLLTSPFTEHHDELLDIFNLSDQVTPECAHFVRLEYTPTDHTYTVFELRVDERRTPGWFDDEQRQAAENAFASLIEKMSVREPRKLLIGGQFLLYEGAVVEKVANCEIAAICGGTISEICGGTISKIWGGTISAIRGGTISAICGGTISAICGGTISEICGGTISKIWGGTISEICGGTISEIWGGTISAICGGTISAIRGGTISAIRGGTISAIGKFANILQDKREK